MSHLDYYIGISNHVSDEKAKVCDDLRQRGAIWSWECSECKDRFLKRLGHQIQYGLVKIAMLHSDLQNLLRKEANIKFARDMGLGRRK